jgi:hypothetical protein
MRVIRSRRPGEPEVGGIMTAAGQPGFGMRHTNLRRGVTVRVMAWLGLSCLGGGLSTAQRVSPSGLTQIVPGVYLYKDTCNVYAIVRGEQAILIDFGSGEILDKCRR